jgi:hypothetical protein
MIWPEDVERGRGVLSANAPVILLKAGPHVRQSSAMAKPAREQGDPLLADLFEQYQGRLVSPGGAAALLGLSRKTIYSICRRGDMRAFHSNDVVTGGGDSIRGVTGSGSRSKGPRWVYIPLEDVRAYAEKTGRLTARMEKWFGGP